MNKKLAISLVLLGEALIYLFLLVAVPAFEAILCPTCNVREVFALPMFYVYFVPALVGVLLIVGIWKQKKEAKGDRE